MIRSLLAIVALVLCVGLAGCEEGSTDPNAPTGETRRQPPATPQPAPGSDLKVESVPTNEPPPPGAAPVPPDDGG